METRNEVLKKAPEPRKEERPRRFQIVKLEERIAPGRGNSGYPKCFGDPVNKFGHDAGPC